MPELNIINVDTDVLIIGGGLAGCMAAINAAAEEGVRVTLVDKSNTRGSGCAALGIDHCWSYIPPVHEQMGFTLDDMWDEMRQQRPRGRISSTCQWAPCMNGCSTWRGGASKSDIPTARCRGDSGS